MRSDRPVRPVAAAGLVLIRAATKGDPEILLGRRHAKSGFLPDVFVVPGGRVDMSDHRSSGPGEVLDPNVAEALRTGANGAAPLTFARCALRETLEETGLMLGCPAKTAMTPAPDGSIWNKYRRDGLRPAFEAMDFVLRAITPTSSPRRYNTRFFLADGGAAHGTILGDGELLDLAWWRLSKLDELPLVDVTRALLKHSLSRWNRRVPVGKEQPKLLIYKNNEIVLRNLDKHVGTQGRAASA